MAPRTTDRAKHSSDGTSATGMVMQNESLESEVAKIQVPSKQEIVYKGSARNALPNTATFIVYFLQTPSTDFLHYFQLA